MVNSLEAINEDIQGQFWATLGLEDGVQEQTQAALDIVREVAMELPNAQGLAVVPVGSRFKGYATLEADLDLVTVAYDEDNRPYNSRRVIGEVVESRLGIPVRETGYHFGADEALTIDLIDYGHPACFGSQEAPFALVPAIFEGERVAEYKHNAVNKRGYPDARYFEFMNRAYVRYFLEAKFKRQGVAERYLGLLAAGVSSEALKDEVHSCFDDAYRQRCIKFGGHVINAFEQTLAGAVL